MVLATTSCRAEMEVTAPLCIYMAIALHWLAWTQQLRDTSISTDPLHPSPLSVSHPSRCLHFVVPQDLSLVQAFNVSLHVSQLQSPKEVAEVLKMYGSTRYTHIFHRAPVLPLPHPHPRPHPHLISRHPHSLTTFYFSYLSCCVSAPMLAPGQIQSIATALTAPIGVKQLLMVLEMARSDVDADAAAGGSGTIGADLFLQCLHTAGF